MNGGSIKHNVAGGKGGGVFLWNNQSGYYETFNMNGGSIIENKSTGNGGGICIDQRGVVCVSGNAVVIGNKKGEDDCNIQGGRINVVGNLTDGASIGFTGDNFSFTSGYSTYNDGDDPALYFVSDNPKSIVVLDYYGTEAALTPLYSITVTSDENGTATANPLTGLSGTEVTLTVTPNDGYIFKEWQVISGGVTITDNKFTIKSSDVEIKAIFKEIIVEVSTWAELQAALNMDGRVRLTQDIIATSGCSSLNVNNEVSLDLNGYIIDGKGLVAPVIYVDRYGVLTINDSRPNQEHIPAFTYTNPITSGDVVVNGGIITGGLNEDNWGAGVEVYRGECTMNGGSIVKNITNGGEGAGVFVHSTGIFTMNDGLIAGNHASGSGGGVNMYDRTTFNMIGGSIKHNTSDANGGGFYLWNNQSGYYEVLNMSGGTIEENKCTGNGGGICIDTRGRVYFSGNPVITGNKKGDTNNNVYGSFGISGTLLDGASIGVTTKQSPLTGGTQTFTGGYNEYNSGDDPANYFVSDFDKALVTLDFQNEACLERAYEVILTTDEHGTATANPTLGLNGTEVTLTATPNNGYTFKEWQVISGGVTITDNKFTFGSSDVEVKAIFEATTMLGDLNDDKTITILDVRLLLQAYINSSSSTEWTEQQLAIMDINDDKKIDILDVRLLLQMYINN